MELYMKIMQFVFHQLVDNLNQVTHHQHDLNINTLCDMAMKFYNKIF